MKKKRKWDNKTEKDLLNWVSLSFDFFQFSMTKITTEYLEVTITGASR